MDTTPDRLANLDTRDAGQFAKTYGPSLAAELPLWIAMISSAEANQQNFNRLNTLAWFIFVERQGVAFGAPPKFHVSPDMAAFQEFIYTFNVFSTINVPFHVWQPVIDLLFSALREVELTKTIDLESRACKDARECLSQTLASVTRDPEYEQRFTDLLNGAL